MSTNALDTIVADCVEALERVGNLFASDAAGRALLARLGWHLSALPAPLVALGGHLRELTPLITEARTHPESPEIWISLASAVAGLVAEIRDLEHQTFGEDLDAAGFGRRLAEQLLHWAAIEQLDRRHPSLLAILRAVGLVRATQHTGGEGRPPYVEERLVSPDFAATFSAPSTLLRAAWAWGDPAFDGSGLLDELVAVFRTFGVPAGFVAFPPSPRELAEVDPGALRWHVIARFLSGTRDDVGYEAGLRVLKLREGTEPAIAVVPYVEGSLANAVEFGDGFEFSITGAASADEGRALLVSPSAIRLVTDLFGTVGPSAVGEISATLRRRRTERVETVVGPAVVQSAGWSIRAAARASHGADGELEVGAAFTDASIVLPVADDGFLGSLIGGKQAIIPAPLVLGFSSRRGVYLGPAGLSHDVSVSWRLGALEVRRISLKLDAVDRGLGASIVTALSAKIGPVNLAVEGLGVSLGMRFPGSGGNLGPIALHAELMPPAGVGLAIDAQAVVGGGYLSFDPQKAEYSGVLELQIAGRIAVKAIGLLTTRMPDGGPGYSLMVLITAGGFAPIPLGFGFTLTAIGGLLAINRTFSEEALRAGLKNHTLDSVMFPADPIRNAPQLLGSLNTVFPPAERHHLFGPMVQIAWGTPPLITADLGLVLEFGARRRLLVLGQVVAVLPRRNHELLRLQMDAIGVLDFDEGTAELDATLYDSRLLRRFVVTGDMAMRVQWQGLERPNLALAVGGLHPAFNPPPKFPKLERLAISLSAGDNPRLRCEAYFALTPNTVQFGARAELYASAIGFSIHGQIGFDVLIQREPFQFLADFYAQVQLKRGSTNLFKVRVEGALTGPRPLHIKAKATFEILWWDVTVRVDKTLVKGEPPPPPEPVDVLPLLTAALGHPGNWTSQLPAGQHPMVTLRTKSQAATDVSLHPLGTLTVTQGVVPLNLEISKFGPAAPAGARRFTISRVSLGGWTLTTRSVTDFFARSEFFEMSDDEKLSSPSFEPLAAGLSFGSDAFAFTDKPEDRLEVSKIAYDTVIVESRQDGPPRSGPDERYELPPDRLREQARFGAAGASALRRTGLAKYRNTTRVGPRLEKEGWSLVATDDLVEAGRHATYTEAVQALRQLQREDPAKAGRVKILRLSEVR
jgi:hypothetical protein